MDASIEPSLAVLPGHLIRRAQQLHVSLWTEYGPPGLTSPQYAVLHALAQHSGIDQTEVGTLASLDRSTLAELVPRLVARDLVTRTRDPDDRRRNLLHLTDHGGRVYRDAVEPVLDVNRRLVAGLSATDRDALLRILGRVVSD